MCLVVACDSRIFAESLPVMGKDLMKVLHKYYNNTLDNIGNHDSFVWYGPR